MKTIIAGSRTCVDMDILLSAIDKAPFKVTEVVCGTALGADTLGEYYAHLNKLKIYYYRPDWYKYGKMAGFIRNKQMALNSQALIALWDGHSKGTANMIRIAKSEGLKLFVYEYTNIQVSILTEFLIDNI
jgi:hypothetical protein